MSRYWDEQERKWKYEPYSPGSVERALAQIEDEGGRETGRPDDLKVRREIEKGLYDPQPGFRELPNQLSRVRFLKSRNQSLCRI